jgi:demethylmenaquinone methyltransferase/2-methoxy-6-polyprenyl-1,4-benzoquinol methylase
MGPLENRLYTFLPEERESMGKAIQDMFDGIARRYDFLNHFLSAGRDKAWRRKAARCLLDRPPLQVLDLCGGTGDFWKTWQKVEAESPAGSAKGFGVIADFSLPMLIEARKKPSPAAGARTALVRMDALRPCFKDGTFDAVICAYGMRNLDSLGTGIEEIRRLLRPGGVSVTLEFFRPTTFFTHFFYRVCAPLCIPLLGGIFSSRKKAYAYLVDSIRGFCSVGEYGESFRARGFREVSVIPCDFGISHIVTAVKA